MSKVTTYYLEMTSKDQLIEKPQPHGLEVIEAKEKEFRFNRYLYQLVGELWGWTDKLTWSEGQWQTYAENDDLRTFVAYVNGSIAGYYELQQQPSGQINIAYFGLPPKFIGRGFGSHLLSHALKTAWDWEGAQRVWVHTCTLDHQRALDNYKACGLQVYKTEMC